MPERSRKKPDFQVKIAKERIEILFAEATRADDDLARRYIKLAKKIGMRYNVKLGPAKKRLYCKHCFTPFKGAKSRLKNGFLVRECRHCKKTARMKYKKI
jgi:ribonuclease P protein subunit RPR2